LDVNRNLLLNIAQDGAIALSSELVVLNDKRYICKYNFEVYI